MDTPESHVIDAFMASHAELKRTYMARGLSAEDADDKATDDVRRQIRSGPPIKLRGP